MLPPNSLPSKVDATNSAAITATFTKGSGGVWQNNADITYTSEAEFVDELVAREMFDINFWGGLA